MQAAKITVHLEEGADLVEYVVRCDNRDQIAYELRRDREQWPEHAPMLWATFMAWHALKRSGAYLETFDTFQSACAFLDTAMEEVSPTQPAPDLV